jgi:hypothetical protein
MRIVANLIVKRRRHWTEGYDKYRIAIDGHHVASISPGETARIEVGPGHHEVAATGGWVSSRSVGIEGEPEATHQLIVAQNPKFNPTWIIATLLIVLPPMVLVLALPPLSFSVWLNITLMHGRADTTSVLMLPLLVLVWLTVFAPFLVMRKSALALVQAPGPDLTDHEIADLLRAQPLRFTVRGLMIILAIQAVVLAIGIQLTRNRRESNFREMANMHAELELPARAMQRRFADDAHNLEKQGIKATKYRQSEARSAARADYHAALRRKYEQALARGWFTVEDDPPPPAWP